MMTPLQYGAVGTVQDMKVSVFVAESLPQTQGLKFYKCIISYKLPELKLSM